MVTLLKIVFAVILLGMLSVSIVAGVHQNIFTAGRDMWPNWWFKAALLDAYFGFLTFFVWVAYKELRLWRKLLWLVAFMLLGNMATASYMLLELSKLQVGDGFETLLTRRNG